MPLVPSSSTPLQPCIGVGEPNIVVRIAIPRNLSTADGDRTVRYIRRAAPPGTPDDDEEQYQESDVNKGGTAEFKANPFHLNLDTIFSAGAPAEWVKVKVILRDRAYRFYDGTGGNNILGISFDSIDKTALDPWLCQKAGEAFSKTTKRFKNVLTFFVRHLPGTPGVSRIASLNFVIVADPDAQSGASGGYQTPILIDPKIKNDG